MEGVYKTGRVQAALALFDTARPGITILDIHMAMLSGVDVLEILRERDPDAVVLMLNGRADVKTAVEAMLLGRVTRSSRPTCPTSRRWWRRHSKDQAAPVPSCDGQSADRRHTHRGVGGEISSPDSGARCPRTQRNRPRRPRAS